MIILRYWEERRTTVTWRWRRRVEADTLRRPGWRGIRTMLLRTTGTSFLNVWWWVNWKLVQYISSLLPFTLLCLNCDLRILSLFLFTAFVCFLLPGCLECYVALGTIVGMLLFWLACLFLLSATVASVGMVWQFLFFFSSILLYAFLLLANDEHIEAFVFGHWFWFLVIQVMVWKD